jgi:hypothetical protein
MRHAKPLCVLAVLLLVSGMTSGCESSSDVCDQAESQMRACNLLSAGEYRCQPPEDDELAHCTVACVGRASCDTMEQTFCGSSATSVTTCVDECNRDAEARALAHDAPTVFECGDGAEVPIGWRCDGEADCLNGTDELSCPSGSTFDCGDGTAVSSRWQCDGERDCSSGADEAGCPAAAELVCE